MACRARVSTKESTSCCSTAYYIFLMEHIKRVFEIKGDKHMGKRKNTFDALIVNLDCFIGLSGNMAGSALLASVF